MPQVALGALMGGLTISGTTLATLSFGWSWGGAIAGAAFAAVSDAMADKPADIPREQLKHTIRQSEQPRRVIYGDVMTAGTLVYAASTGAQNEFLHLVIALADHEISEVSEIWLNDWKVGPLNPTTGYPTTAPGMNGGIRIRYHLGDDYPAAYQELIDDLAARRLERTSQDIPGVTVDSIEDGAATGTGTLRAYPVRTYDPDLERSTWTSYELTWQAAGDTEGARVDVHDSNGQHVLPSGSAGHDLTVTVSLDWMGWSDPDDAAHPVTSDTYDTVAVSGASADWTPDHLGKGVAHVYLRLAYHRPLYPSGIPQIRFRVKGKPTHDPTDAAYPNDTPTYSNNAARVLLDYIRSSHGLSATDAEVHTSSWATATTICDESVAAKSATSITSSAHDAGTVTVTASAHGLRDGDTVLIAGHSDSALNNSTSTLWPVTVVDDDTFTISTTATGGTGGTVQLYQTRYESNGAFDLDRAPLGVVEGMASAMAGAVVYQDGQYRGYAGAATAATVALDEDDLRGPVRLRPRKSRSDGYNAVRGTFVDRFNHWEATDFPPVTNSGYETEDGGERVYRDLSLDWTSDGYAAQRLAKLDLERNRQGMVMEFPASVRSYAISVWDVVTVSIDHLGLATKEFRVLERRPSADGGYDLVLQEEASAIYSWLPSYATSVDPAPNTSLTVREDIPAPTELFAARMLYRGVDGRYRTKFHVTFSAPHWAYVDHFEVEYKEDSEAEYRTAYTGVATGCEILELAHGTYDIRVRAVSIDGTPSAWIYTTRDVIGTRRAVTSLGLSAPVNPRVEYHATGDGRVEDVRFSVTLDTTAPTVPDAYAIMWNVEDQPNKFTTSVLDGTKLRLGGVEILSRDDSYAALSGSTSTRVVCASASNPWDTSVDRARFLWVRINNPGAGRVSSWHKVRTADETGVYLHPTDGFSFTPQVDDPVELLEIAWVDGRPAEYRLVYLSDGTDYEIVRWSSVGHDATGYYLEIAERGAEGTTPLTSLDGLDAYYYPAPGVGTETVVVPLGDLQANPLDATQRVADVNVSVSLPAGAAVSATCAAFIRTTDEDGHDEYVRSPIVPLSAGLF